MECRGADIFSRSIGWRIEMGASIEMGYRRPIGDSGGSTVFTWCEREVASLTGRIGAAIMRRLALVERIAEID
jgi:hypothetical protein